MKTLVSLPEFRFRAFTFSTLVSMLLLLQPLTAQAYEIDWNFLDSTPVGSWQIRQDTTVEPNGKATVSEVKTANVGEETREGEKHLWLEISMQEMKKNGRKGERMIVKALVPARLLQDDPANSMKNFQSMAKEIIVQQGANEPMLMSSNGGAMAAMMQQATGMEIKYDYKADGREEVTTDAGSFESDRLLGTGNITMNLIFKKMTITSESIAWLSKKVPFGVVKSESTDTTDGKVSKSSSTLIEYASSGAESEITATPQEMPAMPNLQDLMRGAQPGAQ